MSEGSATEGMPPVGPEAMRDIVRDYVRALHASYIDTVRHLPPAERGALPLVSGGDVTVVAAASRRLHLVATTDRLPAPQAPEVAVVDEHAGTRWTVRFFDPSVLPGLGILAEDTPEEVRRVLGVIDTVYHLTVEAGGGLTGHHALHSGVALASLHAKTIRDLDRIRHALPRQAELVDELGACARLGLDRAASLLATELTSGRVAPAPGTPAAACVAAVLEDVTRR